MLRTLLLIALGTALVAADLPEIGGTTADVEAAFGVPQGNARARTSGRVVWSYQEFLAVFEEDRVVSVIELPTAPAGGGAAAAEAAPAKPEVAKATVAPAGKSAGKGAKSKALDPSTLNDAAAKVNKANSKKGAGKNGGAQGQSLPPNLQQLLGSALQGFPAAPGRMPRQP